MVQDLCPPDSEEERFFKHPHPTDPKFRSTPLINWQSLRYNLEKDTQRYLERIAQSSRQYWAICHVLSGDEFDWQIERPLEELTFRVVALQKGEWDIGCSSPDVGDSLFRSSDCSWWSSFRRSLRQVDYKTETAPMYCGEWESYFEIVYCTQALAALRSASDQLGIKGDRSVRMRPWPTTGVSASDMIAPNGKLHIFACWEGDTFEGALNRAYGYNKFASNKS